MAADAAAPLWASLDPDIWCMRRVSAHFQRPHPALLEGAIVAREHAKCTYAPV
jgi:hypothetical protein